MCLSKPVLCRPVVTISGISINDEAVNYAFAGDHVAVIITGIDMAHVGIGKLNSILTVLYLLEILTHLSLSIFLWDIDKQCRSRSDVAEHGVWSGSPLFAYRKLY